MKEEFDFESFKNEAIEQLKAGKPLLGYHIPEPLQSYRLNCRFLYPTCCI